MDNTINPKKYINLPIASLITGILSLTVFSLQALQMLFSNFLTTDNAFKIFSTIIVTILGIILPIVAIVCGNIGLARIRKGLHRSKIFKAFDIIGIVLGSIVFLIVAIFNFGPMILQHR
jgi:hypothetical protein